MKAAVETVSGFYAALTSGVENDAYTFLADDVIWCAAHPINDLAGASAFFSDYWAPIREALPDLEYRPFVRVAGVYDGKTMDGDGSAGDWVTATGYLVGTFRNSLFGIPPTHRTLFLRFGELLRVEGRRIREGYVILDFLDAMQQAGVGPLRASLGHPGLVMPPSNMDGLLRPRSSVGESQASLQLVLDMISGLMRFDGKSLSSMNQERYWHKDFMWYGPAGIGTSRGMEGFRAHHQGPFLKGFPIRGVDRTKCLVADGAYVATGGWPHMTAVHNGGGWLGLAPTGRKVTMRVMDFWRRDGEKLKENWVSIDVIDLCGQLGLDVFGQMRELLGDSSEYLRGR